MKPFHDFTIPSEPFLFATPEQIEAARAKTQQSAWAAEIRDECLRIAEPWINHSREELVRLIPGEGALYTSFYIKPVDPETGELLEWCGWDDPFSVINPQGKKYSGAPFNAQANTGRVAEIENIILPALATAWIVTSDERYAQAGLWLFDAIAAVHPSSKAGPYNYPGLPEEGGRLYRPLFQVARGVMRYAYSYEILATYAGIDAPSPCVPGMSIRENLLNNLFRDAGRFCFDKVRQSRNLTNGTIDYNRGVMIAGALLGIPEYLEHATNGLELALANAVSPAGHYYETSPGYASHTIHLLLTLARLADGVNRHFKTPLPSYFDNGRLAAFCLNSFSAVQAAGRLPAFGDTGPDRTVATDDRWFDPMTYFACLEFLDRSQRSDIRAQARQQLNEMLSGGDLDNLAPDTAVTLKRHHLYLAESILLLHPEPVADTPSSTTTPAASTVIPFSGVARLRQRTGATQEQVALMRYGATCPHGHKDEMALQLFRFGQELSADPGYFNTHYRVGFTLTTVAHNTVTVERQSQHAAPSAGGTILSWNAGRLFSSVEADDPDCYRHLDLQQYQRRVATIACDGANYWIDLFRVRGASEYDYGFHALPQATLSVIAGAQCVESRTGSLYSETVDYGADLQGDGRLRSFPEKEFGWSPPGEGYGFLRNPMLYQTSGTVLLDWRSNGDDALHVVSHLIPPPGAELLTAHLSAPNGIMETDYAISRVTADPKDCICYAAVIRASKGELAEPWTVSAIEAAKPNLTSNACGLEIRGGREFLHRHYSSDQEANGVLFADGAVLTAREGFAAFAKDGSAHLLLISGPGQLSCGGVTLRCQSPFTKESRIMAVKNTPLRILVSECNRSIEKAIGMIVRINSDAYRIPLSFHLVAVEWTDEGCWLALNADGVVQSLIIVTEINGFTISTETPLPRVTPLLDLPYNGGFDGYLLRAATHPEAAARIQTFSPDRRHLYLATSLPGLQPGDRLYIEAPAIGDQVDLLPWSEATRHGDEWHLTGLGEIAPNAKG